MKTTHRAESIIEKTPAPKQQVIEKSASTKDIKKTEDQSISAIKLFGINIVGMDPRLISNAQLILDVPLNAGQTNFMGLDKDAKVKIREGSNAHITLELARNKNGVLSLRDFSFELNHSIVIKNPSASLLPHKGKSRFGTAVKDRIADLKLKSIGIDSEGNISVNGKIKALHLLKKRLPKNAGSMKLPAIDESVLVQLGIIEKDEPNEKKNLSALRDRFNIKKLLCNLGAMTKEASYELSLNADRSHILLTKDNNFFRGPSSPISVALKGTIDLEPKGDLLFVVDGKKSQISGSLGIHAPHLEAKIRHLTDDKPISIRLHGELEGEGRDLRLDTFSQQQMVKVLPRQRHIGKSVAMPKSEDEYNTTLGAQKIDVSLSFDAQIRVDKGINVKKGSGRVSLLAHEPYAKTHERGITMEGAVSANFHAKKMVYDDKRGLRDTRVMASFGIHPNEKTREQFSEIKPVSFHYKVEVDEANEARITPPPYGLTRFIRPVKNFECHDERVDTVQTKSHISPIGTKKYFRQIEKIAGIKIKKAQNVELLIDGIRSMPKRLALIQSAKSSICFQTLAFKSDSSGWQYAEALVDAAKRGVKVYGVVDSLGNIESLKDLKEPNSIYQFMQENGVNIHLYNSFIEKGIRSILAMAQKYPDVFPAHNAHSLLGVAELLRFFEAIAEVSDNQHGPLSAKDRHDLRKAIHTMLGGKSGASPHNAVAELKKAISNNMTTLDEFLLAIKRVGDASYRWHEKYLIVDGAEAIVGGMNIADEYLLGGSGEQVVIKNKAQPAWRDSDVYVHGEVVEDIVHNFKNNWLHVAKVELKLPESAKVAESKHVQGSYNVGMIHHRPLEDGDHNVTNFLLYNLRTLKPGEKAWFETPYFLPRGALRALQKEMVLAAKRGVDLRILTNSEKTSDFGPLVQAAVFDTRELLQAGARVFHRNQDRMVHAKVYVLGEKLTMIGSWNMDNRSAAHDSEDICAIYDEDITREMSLQLLVDMFEQSDEIKLADIKARPLTKEIQSAAMLLIGEII